MYLRTFVCLVLLAFLVAFACNKYMQASDVGSLKQGVKNIRESVTTQQKQYRSINEELDKR